MSRRGRLTISGRLSCGIAALMLVGCNVAPGAAPNSGGAQPTTPPGAQPNATSTSNGPIVIGVSQALTGDKSDGGTAIERGYQVWIKEVNAEGGLLGRQVQLKDYDNQSLADTAVSQYERLITADKVDLILGPVSSALTIPTSAVAEKYKMTMVEGAGGAPKVFERHFHYLIDTQPATAEHQADVFTEFILALPTDKRPKSVAYPSMDDPFALAVVDQAKSQLDPAGIKNVYEQKYPPTQTDFGPIANAIKASGAEMVLGGSSTTADVAPQVQAYAAINYQPVAVYFSSGPDESITFKEALGERTEGIFNSTGWTQASKNPGNDKFVQDYLDMFPNKDNEVPTEAAEGYSAAQVLGAAVKGTQSTDNTRIASWLHENKVQTVQGLDAWDADGRPTGRFTLMQWQKGVFHAVGPIGDPSKDAEPEFPKPKW